MQKLILILRIVINGQIHFSDFLLILAIVRSLVTIIRLGILQFLPCSSSGVCSHLPRNHLLCIQQFQCRTTAARSEPTKQIPYSSYTLVFSAIISTPRKIPEHFRQLSHDFIKTTNFLRR